MIGKAFPTHFYHYSDLSDNSESLPITNVAHTSSKTKSSVLMQTLFCTIDGFHNRSLLSQAVASHLCSLFSSKCFTSCEYYDVLITYASALDSLFIV